MKALLLMLKSLYPIMSYLLINCLVKQCDTVEEYEELINKALALSKEEYEEFHKNTQKMIQNFDWENLSLELEKIFQYINNL